MEPMKRVDHIGIAVHAIEPAMHLYQQLLGITEWERISLPERAMEVAVGRIGDVLLELIAPTGSEAAFATFLENRGEGVHHIAFEVADIQATLHELASQGVRLINQTAQPGIHDTKVAFIHPKAAHGVLIELVEH